MQYEFPKAPKEKSKPKGSFKGLLGDLKGSVDSRKKVQDLAKGLADFLTGKKSSQPTAGAKKSTDQPSRTSSGSEGVASPSGRKEQGRRFVRDRFKSVGRNKGPSKVEKPEIKQPEVHQEVKESKLKPSERDWYMNMKALKAKRRRQLASQGIRFPIFKTRKGFKYLLDRRIPKNYEDFRNKVISKLQPDVKDIALAEKNAGKIIGRFAVGRFQIVYSLHCEKVGLRPGNLEDIYYFMSHPDVQKRCFDIIRRNAIAKYFKPGRPVETALSLVAISYYGGPGVYRNWLKTKKNLKSKDPEKRKKAEKYEHSVKRPQSGGGSLLQYANKAQLWYFYFKEHQGMNQDQAIAKTLEQIETKGGEPPITVRQPIHRDWTV